MAVAWRQGCNLEPHCVRCLLWALQTLWKCLNYLKLQSHLSPPFPEVCQGRTELFWDLTWSYFGHLQVLLLCFFFFFHSFENDFLEQHLQFCHKVNWSSFKNIRYVQNQKTDRKQSLFFLFELRKGRRKRGSKGKEHRTASEGIMFDKDIDKKTKTEKLKPVIHHTSLITIFA